MEMRCPIHIHLNRYIHLPPHHTILRLAGASNPAWFPARPLLQIKTVHFYDLWTCVVISKFLPSCYYLLVFHWIVDHFYTVSNHLYSIYGYLHKSNRVKVNKNINKLQKYITSYYAKVYNTFRLAKLILISIF